MKKIHIIIAAVIAILAFGGSFGLTWFIKSRQVVLPETEKQSAEQGSDGIEVGETPLALMVAGGSDHMVRSLTEKQLQSLIYDIREKKSDYEYREKLLDKQEERIRVASEALQKDIEKLNDLLLKLTDTEASLMQREKNLTESLVEIDELEKRNMVRIAERYDKMDVKPAGKIMINMVKNKQEDDVAMILNYMGERQSADLLAEIADTNADVATMLNRKLSRIKEVE